MVMGNLKKLRQKAERYIVRQGLAVFVDYVDSDVVCNRGRFALYSMPQLELLGMLVIDTNNNDGVYRLLTPEEMEPQEAAE